MHTAPMPGRTRPPWCPHCHTNPGPDCPDVGRTPRQVRRDEARMVADEITEGLHEWAEQEDTR